MGNLKNNKSRKTINYKNFTNVHRGVGLIFMPLLLVIVLSGAWSLFRAELLQWQFPQFDIGSSKPYQSDSALSLSSSEEDDTKARKSWQELVTIARQEYGFVYDDFSIHDKERYGDFVLFYNKTDGNKNLLFMNPVSGKAINASQASVSESIYDLHMRMLLPISWGKYLVGVFGLVLTYLVFTGLLSHKGISKNFYQLRLHQGRQIFTTDIHKLLGSWSLTLSGLLSITGALLGLFGILLMVLALAAYGGDQQALFADFLGVVPEAQGGVASYQSLDSLYQTAQQQWSDFTISTIEFHNFADPAMHVTFEGELMNGLLTQQHITFNAINGQPSFITDFTDKGLGGYLYSALPSVHFASFGGIWLKLIYWFLTMLLLFVMVIGISVKALRLRKRSFSRLDWACIKLGESVILTGSVIVVLALSVPMDINSGHPTTMAWCFIVCLLYTVLSSKFLPNYRFVSSVYMATWILLLATIPALISGQWLLTFLYLTLAVTWWGSSSVSRLVARQDYKTQ